MFKVFILIATVMMNKHENLYHLFLYYMIFIICSDKWI